MKKQRSPTSQKFRANRKNGFTLVEVIVAAVIFLLSAAGLLATISAMSQPAAQSSREMTATLIGKQVLEELRQDVDAVTWDTVGANLEPAVAHVRPAVLVDGVTYTPTYTVTPDPQGTRGRVVNVTVTWNE